MKISFQQVGALLLAVLLAQAAGALGTLFTVEAIPTWYAALQKPVFSPPNWLFGPVWTLLYTCMGVASYLVWRKRKEKGVIMALWFYAVQLVLNALWSIIFFGFKSPGIAFAEIIVMLACIVITTVQFFRYSRWAGGLMIPYILWVSFASVLNASIWLLNA